LPLDWSPKREKGAIAIAERGLGRGAGGAHKGSYTNDGKSRKGEKTNTKTMMKEKK